MATIPHVTYGLGGFNPDKPNSNVTESVTIEVPDPPPTTTEERLAALESQVAGTTGKVDRLTSTLLKSDTITSTDIAEIGATPADVAALK